MCFLFVVCTVPYLFRIDNILMANPLEFEAYLSYQISMQKTMLIITEEHWRGECSGRYSLFHVEKATASDRHTYAVQFHYVDPLEYKSICHIKHQGWKQYKYDYLRNTSFSMVSRKDNMGIIIVTQRHTKNITRLKSPINKLAVTIFTAFI